MPGLIKHFALSSDVSAGLVASSFALGRFSTTALWPIASDSFGRRRILCITLLGGAVGAALQGMTIVYAWPFLAFLLARGMTGIFSAIVPVMKAYIVERFEHDDVPKVLSYREAAGTFAFVVGPAIGGALATKCGVASPLLFAAVSSAFAMLLAARCLPYQAPATREQSPAPGRSK